MPRLICGSSQDGDRLASSHDIGRLFRKISKSFDFKLHLWIAPLLKFFGLRRERLNFTCEVVEFDGGQSLSILSKHFIIVTFGREFGRLENASTLQNLAIGSKFS